MIWILLTASGNLIDSCERRKLNSQHLVDMPQLWGKWGEVKGGSFVIAANANYKVKQKSCLKLNYLQNPI